MRILHTADWHLGIKLYDKDLSEDHEIFFAWLINLIKERGIQALLISGDIFHQKNPTAEARNLYYSFLKQLINVKCKVIMTSGNHDSPAVLNGPKDILAMLNVNIVASVPSTIDEGIIELKNENDGIVCVICAVPYLRDADIRTATENETYKNRVQQNFLGMKTYFDTVVNYASQKYGKTVPLILMGHLFASGVVASDSERDILRGGLEMFSANDFPKNCNYIALGHIHKPQKIGNSETIRYSGSPIPLRFSEKNDNKIVIELDVSDNCIQKVMVHEIPSTRTLRRFSGTFKEVQTSLDNFKNNKELKCLAELEIIEKNYDPSLRVKVHKFPTEFKSDDVEILGTPKLTFLDRVSNLQKLYDDKNVEDLIPKDILLKKLEIDKVEEDQRNLIIEAFEELLHEINEK